jgi:transposase
MGKAGRPLPELILSDEEREELVRLTKRARVNRGIAFRAKLVLGCAEGVGNSAIARRHRTTNHTVGKWRRRFVEDRLEGLFDEPRVGAPRTISDAEVEAVVVKTLETKSKGRTHWSTRSMAANVGMSHSTIGRVWRTFGLKPHVTRSFKMSEDPQLVGKGS